MLPSTALYNYKSNHTGINYYHSVPFADYNLCCFLNLADLNRKNNSQNSTSVNGRKTKVRCTNQIMSESGPGSCLSGPKFRKQRSESTRTTVPSGHEGVAADAFCDR